MSDCQCKARERQKERESQLTVREKAHGVTRTTLVSLGVNRVSKCRLRKRAYICRHRNNGSPCEFANIDEYDVLLSCLKCGCRMMAKAKDAKETCEFWEKEGV